MQNQNAKATSLDSRAEPTNDRNGDDAIFRPHNNKTISFQDRQVRAMLELSKIATIGEWQFGDAKDGSDERGVKIVIRFDQSVYGCYLANEDKLFVQLQALEYVNDWAEEHGVEIHLVDLP